MEEAAHHQQEQHRNKRIKLEDNETENNIPAAYKFIKVTTGLEIVDKTKGELNSPFTPLGSDYSTTVLFVLDQVFGIPTLDSQVQFFNRRILIHRNEQTIITFLDRDSGRMQQAVLKKFTNAFFAALLDSIPLSLRSRESQ